MGKQKDHEYSVEDETLLELSHSLGSFRGHHHHHHHAHSKVAYQRPKTLDTNLGLFALKKLTAMNPRLLTMSERRLLQPVAPGFLTYFSYATMLSIMSGYGVYIWRGYGYKAFVSKPVLPLIGLAVAYKGTMYGINFVREQLFNP